MMRVRRSIPCLATLCLLFAATLAAGPAYGTVTVFTSRAAWEASLDGVVTDTLESTAVGNTPTPLALSGGVLLTSPSASPVTIQVFDNGILGSRELHFRDFTSGVRFSLANNGNAFGFDYHVSENWILSANGKSTTLPGQTTGFVGYIDDAAPILSFSLTGAAGAQGGISVDDLSRIGTVFGGLAHRALGQAQLARGAEGSLLVSNVGSSGEDGVAIDLGEIEAFTTELPLRPSSTPVGAFMESRLRGMVNGVADQPAGWIGLRRTVDGYDAIVDFSAAGSPTYTATFFDRQGRAVFSQSGLSGETVAMKIKVDIDLTCTTTTTTTTTTKETTTTTKTTSWKLTVDIDWKVGAQSFRAAQVTFVPEPPAASGDNVTNVNVVAAQMPAFQILGEMIGAFGVSHRALGNSVFSPAAGRLTVSNLGSTGQDGVSADLGRVESVDLALAPIDPGSSAPEGAFLQAQATGSVNGVPEQSLGALKVTRMGSDFQVTADFSGIGSPTQRVQVLQAGAVVADLPGHSGPVGLAKDWPRRLGKLGGQPECYVLHFPLESIFRIDGIDHTGDELRVLAEGSRSAIDYKSDFAIRMSGIPELTIVGVQATSCAPAITVQPPASVSVTAGQAASFAVSATGTGALTYQWRKNGVNLANGGTVSGAATSTLKISSTVAADAAVYDVVVSNGCGQAVSARAVLAVTPAPPPPCVLDPGLLQAGITAPVRAVLAQTFQPLN